MSETQTPPEFGQQRQRNPFGNGHEVAVRPQANLGALASAEQQRVLGEIQAQIMLAKMYPRDPQAAVDNILRDCSRVTLAQAGQYEYARGGTDIRGPSIKLMEAIARRWGNLSSGFKVIHSENGVSEVVSYAWCLESGYRDERQFSVPHIRDTRKGPVKLTDERDIYELIANNAQRRKRACLQAVIPADVIEAAIEQCQDTLSANVDTSVAGLKKMLKAFSEFGVTQAQIEQRAQCKLEAISPGQVTQLSRIYMSLKDGMSQPSQWFRAADPPRQQSPRPQQTQPVQPPSQPSETTPTDRRQEQMRQEQANARAKEIGEQALDARTNVAKELVSETSREQVPDTLSGQAPDIVRQQFDHLPPDPQDEPDQFSYMILGEDGEPIDGEEHVDPLSWAQALLASLASSDDRAAMLVSNATALAEAKAVSPEADALLDGIEAHIDSTLPDEPVDELADEPGVDEDERISALILQHLPTLQTGADIIAYSKSPTVMVPIQRWQAAGRTGLVTSVKAAFSARIAALRGDGA